MIGVTQGHVSRVLYKGDALGVRFIAGVLDVFGTRFLDDLFVVVPDDHEDTA
jgi:hypothetical protein